MKVIDAAKLIGCSPQTIRLGLQQERFGWGTAVKTSTRWTYVIYENKLKEVLHGGPKN